MKKIVTRFGEVEYDPDNLLCFPSGLIGFAGLHHFVVMPNRKKGPLFWIQSIDDPVIAFILTDPTNFFPNYGVIPDDAERRLLMIGIEDQCHTLSIVTVPPDQQLTLNLAAPVLYAPTTNRAIQTILDNSQYSTQCPLPKPAVIIKN